MSRRPVRPRPIRLFLMGMFAVPLVSLLVLYGLIASVTIRNAVTDHNFDSGGRAITPVAEPLAQALGGEREATYTWLLTGRHSSSAPVRSARQRVDQATKNMISGLNTVKNLFSPQAKAQLEVTFRELRQLSSIRSKIDDGSMMPSAAFGAFSAIIDDEFGFFYTSILVNDNALYTASVASIDSGYALEMIGREIALVDTDLTVYGKMSTTDRVQFARAAASRSLLISRALALLPPALSGDYGRVNSSANYQRFAAMESLVATAEGNSAPVNLKRWESVSGAYVTSLVQVQSNSGPVLDGMAVTLSDRLTLEAVLAVGLGLVAVIVSAFVLVWFSRKITGDLGQLHTSVRGMAEERLPRVVDRLRRGEDVDVLAESPAPAPSGISEVSQIAASFGTVQEAAVAAAVEQARLRRGVNQVFLNISMRNQSLLHRQLGMLDSMERRTSEPGALADLFRLDHLTTRMRRHAEGLIILSGSTPGRGWREPVPVVDVLRAAVAEVEDYVRVDVLSESRDLVAGSAVNDVIHLAAELIENAAVFSPPNTRIEVRADRAGTGLVAEIEDRGLGLSREELADINRRLASPPEFDLDNSEQLGLFVVSRLAARHAIKVSLRQSVYGGTTAILLLPFGVIVRDAEAGAPPAEPGADSSQPGPPAPLAGLNGSNPETAPQPAFGVTGRHRLPSAATGRRADIGVTGHAAEQDRTPAPEPWPRAPWEYAGPGSAVPPSMPPAERPPRETEASTLWSEAFRRPAAPQVPAGPAPAPRAQAVPAAAPETQRGQQGQGPASSGSHLGMPIRVPQASMAPQLRGRARAGRQETGSAPPHIDERSPEATRNMLNLMQQGWERGRADDLDAAAGNPDGGTDR